MMSRFDNIASQWDKNPRRQWMTQQIISALKSKIFFRTDMIVADLGTGTGLILTEVYPSVKQIVGFDNSKGMLDVLSHKIQSNDMTNASVEWFDAEKGLLPSNSFDVLVSAMTFHHVSNVSQLCCNVLQSLKPGGKCYVVDLCTEDGTFHDNNEGVKHFGFDGLQMKTWLVEAGFENVSVEQIFEIEKPQGKYPVFGAYAQKKSLS